MIYAEAAVENGWSRNVLAMQIESGYHKRIGKSANNFEAALLPEDSDSVNKMIKDPYVFDLQKKTRFKNLINIRGYDDRG